MSTKNHHLIIIVIVMAILSNCRSITLTPQGNCDIQSLLYDPKQFNLPQEGLEEDIRIESPAPEAPPISAQYSFYYQKDSSADLIQNWVFQYRFIKQATDFYNARERYESRADIFQISENFKSWTFPDGSLLQPHANQYHIACGSSIFQAECTYIARYEKYFVLFQIGLDTKTLQIEDFANGVKKIDELLAACVSK
jgi:hypothetical protein